MKTARSRAIHLVGVIAAMLLQTAKVQAAPETKPAPAAPAPASPPPAPDKESAEEKTAASKQTAWEAVLGAPPRTPSAPAAQTTVNASLVRCEATRDSLENRGIGQAVASITLLVVSATLLGSVAFVAAIVAGISGAAAAVANANTYFTTTNPNGERVPPMAGTDGFRVTVAFIVTGLAATAGAAAAGVLAASLAGLGVWLWPGSNAGALARSESLGSAIAQLRAAKASGVQEKMVSAIEASAVCEATDLAAAGGPPPNPAAQNQPPPPPKPVPPTAEEAAAAVNNLKGGETAPADVAKVKKMVESLPREERPEFLARVKDVDPIQLQALDNASNAKVLRTKPASLDKVGRKNGQTYLTLAVAAKDRAWVKQLLDWGANPCIPNAWGDTPWSLVEDARFADDEVRTLLEAKKAHECQ